jgi:hypothetical protein
MPYNTKEKRSLYQKKRYKLQKDKILEKGRKWRENNKEKSKETQRNYYQSPKGKYGSYKNGAKERNINFDLTFNDFIGYWQLPCNYCGNDIVTIGIDRIDSSIGYEKNNIVPCCEKCNRMKMDNSKEDFLNQCFRILKFQGLI